MFKIAGGVWKQQHAVIIFGRPVPDQLKLDTLDYTDIALKITF